MENNAEQVEEKVEEQKSFDLIMIETKENVYKLLQDSKIPLSVLNLLLGEINGELKLQLDIYRKTVRE